MDTQGKPEDVVHKALSPWARIRLQLKEPFAEFLGTCLVSKAPSLQNTSLKVFEMVASLQGAVAQVYLSDLQFGSYFSISAVTGTAVMLGVLIAGPVSGGHLNPSVTLAFVIFRRLSLKKAALYFIGQVRRCPFCLERTLLMIIRCLVGLPEQPSSMATTAAPSIKSKDSTSERTEQPSYLAHIRSSS